MTLSGVLLALVPALGWGLQALCMQLVGGKFTQKVTGMVFTVLLVGIIVAFIKPPHITSSLIIGSILCGVFWSVGMILQVKSYDLVGVSMTMPISTGEQLFGTALVGAIFLHEWTDPTQWGLGIAALIIIIIGITMTAYHENKGPAGTNVKKGMIILLISSIGFIGYASFPAAFHLNGWDVILPQAIAMFVTTLILVATQHDKEMFAAPTWKNMLTGAFFEVGNLGILFSNAINGVAVGFTFSQLNVVISTLGGLWILHESKTSKEKKFIIAGLILVVAGAIMIGITKR